MLTNENKSGEFVLPGPKSAQRISNEFPLKTLNPINMLGMKRPPHTTCVFQLLGLEDPWTHLKFWSWQWRKQLPTGRENSRGHDLLKTRQSGNAFEEAQFFKICRGTSSVSCYCLIPAMHAQHQTQQTEEIHQAAQYSQNPVSDPMISTDHLRRSTQ
jgi:hypothetical protein